MHYVLAHESPDERGTERWFTISSAPSENEIRISTRINHEHSSSFKAALKALKPGDEIEADGPKGGFTLKDPNENYVFIVGGIGITPIRSILIEAEAKGLKPHAKLLYANRTEEIAFRNELDELKNKNPNLDIRYLIDPERLDESVLRSAVEANKDALFYVSGPEPMVKALYSQLLDLGVAEDSLLKDTFPGYEGI
jgi:ferredoxin-NADP reductase